MTLEVLEKPLEGNLVVRPVVMEDLENAVNLFNVCSKLELGIETAKVEDLRQEWESPGFSLEASTRAVYTPDGEMVAYTEVWDNRDVPVRPAVWGRVHPDYRGRGIGTMLMAWSEERALQAIDRCPPEARVVMMSWLHESATDAKELVSAQGMEYTRSSYQMLIEMSEAPPAPIWPEGITITTFEQFNDVEALFRAHLDAFQDHRGFVEEPFDKAFERFKHFMLTGEHFNPSIWYLAMAGNEIAGYSICEPKAWDDPDKAFVDILGVRRPYRKQGLGLALLHYTFGEFWKKGVKKVGLGVDGTSITNAVALYERAGMHIFRRYDTFEKELRPGVELSKQ